jgi:hypothetical protein
MAAPSRPILSRVVDSVADLRVLLASRYPLILADEQDEQRFMGLLREAGSALNLGVWVWSSTQGLVRDGMQPQYGTADAGTALQFVGGVTDPGVFAFLDPAPLLRDPVTVRRIKELAQSARPGMTLAFAGAHLDCPAELDGLAVPWSLPPPSRDELERLVRDTIRQLMDRNLAVALDDDGIRELADSLRGLSASAAVRLVQQAAFSDGRLDASDLPAVRTAKAQLLDADGPLELVQSRGTLDAVGGMARLKDWLAVRAKAMRPEAAATGIDPPRGVLLTGVPGCGKSLVAKTVSGAWGLPLLLLDPARLFGPYVGQTEQRLQAALDSAEAMAPAVLWVDEIEKGLGGGAAAGGDSGVSARLLGTFLRWMQDRPPGVFIVATANEVATLPPEFLRKGRFDEIFFVDLPTEPEREAIFRLHLSARGHDPAGFDLPSLAGAADGFSGAEIEAVVVGASYRAFAAGRPLATGDLQAEIAGTVPLSRGRAEDLSALRAWAAGRAVPVG